MIHLVHCISFGTEGPNLNKKKKGSYVIRSKLKNHLTVLVHVFIREQWWKNLCKGLTIHHLQSNVEVC